MGFTHRMGRQRTDRRVRFERLYMPEPNSGCWLWLGCLRGNRADLGFPYGGFQWETTKTEFAHRASWMLFRGQIPSGLHVCHKCDNPLCVNPDHLFLGDAQANMRDMFAKGRNKGYYRKGESSRFAKLSADDVRAIRASGESQMTLAKMYGMSKGAISHIKTNRTWTHI